MRVDNSVRRLTFLNQGIDLQTRLSPLRRKISLSFRRKTPICETRMPISGDNCTPTELHMVIHLHLLLEKRSNRNKLVSPTPTRRAPLLPDDDPTRSTRPVEPMRVYLPLRTVRARPQVATRATRTWINSLRFKEMARDQDQESCLPLRHLALLPTSTLTLDRWMRDTQADNLCDTKLSRECIPLLELIKSRGTMFRRDPTILMRRDKTLQSRCRGLPR